jgi:chain length determinant protein EpsF
MTLSQLLQILWARKALLLGVLLAVVLAALGISLALPKVYVAQVSFVADIKGTDPVSGSTVSAQPLPSYLGTQMDIITSHNVALKVVDKYKLVEIPEVRTQFQETTEGVGSIRDWLADNLLNNLAVTPSRDSNVFRLSFSAPDPDYAAELANAFADAYIETSIELKMDPAKRQSAWFDEQMIQLRKALESAQQRLSDFQKTNTLVSTDDRLDVETARLAGISNELVAAQAAMSDAQTRRAQMTQAFAKDRLEELPDILGNGLLQSMKADLTRAEGKLSEVAERYGRNHPQYISAAAEVETLKTRLAAELNTAKGSINQTAEIAKQRAAEMLRALNEQKQRILDLKRATDQRDVLTRDMESAQRTYEAAAQRASAVRLESQLDQSSVAILNPAVRPLIPDRPRVLINVVLSFVIGAMLGACVALGSELLDRRVRSVTDLAEASGVEVLAELPKPARRNKRIKSPFTARLRAIPVTQSA